jgi:hypothetical protein
MNNPEIDRDKMSDVSITDLIAEARAIYGHLPFDHIANRLADALESSERELRLAEDQANNLAGDLAALESVTAPTENEQSAEVMRILNNAGAYCGECGYEGGYGQDGCSQCAVTLATYARHLIAAGFRLPVPVEPSTEVSS